MPGCGIVILAAGASTRMGTPKQLLQFEGASLLRRAVNTAIASVCRPIVVVIGSNAEQIQPELEDLPVIVIRNEKWSAGMGTSIRTGISAVGAVDAAMIFLCDQPLITADLLDALFESHLRSGRSITAATYAGTTGTPVIFAAEVFSEIQMLEDSEGGKAIIRRDPGRLNLFPLSAAAMDVDTPSDFERMARAENKE